MNTLMGNVFWKCFRIAMALLIGVPGFAQTPPSRMAASTNQAPQAQPPEDPLMALMVAQPPIDTTSPVTAFVEFDPPVAAAGQAVVYRVTLNALLESVEWPEALPVPPGVAVRPGGRGTLLRMAGSNIVAHSSLLYHLNPASEGSITWPAFQVKAYGRPVEIPAAVLQVLDRGAVNVPSARRVVLELLETEAFVGQEVRVRVVSASAPDGLAQPLAMPQVISDDIIVDRSYRAQRIEGPGVGGRSAPAYVFETAFTPIRTGRIELTAQGFVVAVPAPGPGGPSRTGGAAGYVLIDSQPVSLTVSALPEANGIEGFTGGIGKFSLDSPQVATNRVRVGDPVTLSVTVRGEGNLERVSPPPPPDAPGWQVFSGTLEELPAGKVRERGFTVFRYVLIPLDAGIRATPQIPFSVFDPVARQYRDLGIAGVPLELLPADPSGAGGVSEGSVLRRGSRDGVGGRPGPALELAALAGRPGRGGAVTPLQDRAGFAWAIVLMAAGFASLVAWERRRTFLDAHPEVRVRRRARRAVRLNQKLAARAGAAGDADRWLAHTMEGLREACAPWLQANARALSCRDILGLLASGEGDEGEQKLVRRLFEVAHGVHFGRSPSGVTEVFALRPELDRLLTSLRRRL